MSRGGASGPRWLGIDFSGDHLMWRPGRRTNAWIAAVGTSRGRLVLDDVRPVTALPGAGSPFERLAELLRGGDFAAAAVDAPFSIPGRYLRGTHRALLARVAALGRTSGTRPFAPAVAFVHGVTGQLPPLTPPKPYRETEACWRARGVNVRSTLWAGPRGGAAMTAACLTLLALADRPMWPWSRTPGGLLVEAFPAAQLARWELPFERYARNDPQAFRHRETIVDALAGRLVLGARRRLLIRSADALDALLCAFAAIAVAAGVAPTPDRCSEEGWIAVHP